MPVINGVYLKDFTALPGAVADANIIPIAISGDNIAYRTTVSGIVTDARVTSKLLTGLSITGSAVLATDTILQAFGKVQNQLNGKQGTITLTTTGSSGAATLIGSTLNIPNYGGALTGYVTLDTTQTITGIKTFANGAIKLAAASTAKALNLENIGGLASTSPTENYFGFNVNNDIYFSNGNSSSGIFSFTNTNLRTYTLPDASGTIALVGGAGVGTVTSVAALTLGTTGTDLSSTVANGTTTPVITLNVPDASATARGVITTGAQTIAGAKTLTGALVGTTGSFASSGGSDTFSINHSSGSGIALNITKGGNGEGIYVNKTSGSGNAVTIIGTLNATTLVKSGGTSSEFLMADGSVNTSVSPTGAYLPLSGGTLTGALAGTSATFTAATTGTQIIINGADTTNQRLEVTDGTVTNRFGIFGRTNGDAGVLGTQTNHPLIFNTNATERMRITSGGNVLIGTTTDSGEKFQITGGRIYANGTGTSSGITFNNYNIHQDASTNLIYRNGGTEIFKFANSGAVTIANLAGSGSRAVLADANGLLSAPVSDISVKENIVPIGYGLNEIMKMNPVWFDFVDEYKNFGEGRQNGNIAQEIAEIIPEAVFTTKSTGKMGINYDQIHAVYIKAIQELNNRITQLENN
jgi:hypothetical protein